MLYIVHIREDNAMNLATLIYGGCQTGLFLLPDAHLFTITYIYYQLKKNSSYNTRLEETRSVKSICFFVNPYKPICNRDCV